MRYFNKLAMMLFLLMLGVFGATSEDYTVDSRTELQTNSGWGNITTSLNETGSILEENEDEGDETEDSEYAKLCSLYKYLFQPHRYNPLFRPIRRQGNPIEVQIRVKLFDLVSIDDVSQRMVTNCYIVLFWNDEFIRWDHLNEYKGITYLAPNISDIWKPGLELYNSPEKKDVLGYNSQIPPTVMMPGLVIWGFHNIFITSCNLDMNFYPFDVQTCKIELKSATNPKYNMFFSINENYFNTSSMATNYGWDLMNTSVKIDEVEIDEIYFHRVVFTLTLKRRSLSILFNDILPTVALCFLNCFVFVVPDESGESISFGISVVLSLAVYLSYTSTKLPSATEGTPAVSKFLSGLFGISLLSVILTITKKRLQQYVKKLKREGNEHAPSTRMTPETARTRANNNLISKANTDGFHPNDSSADDDKVHDEAKRDSSRHIQDLNVTVMATSPPFPSPPRWLPILETVLKYTDKVAFVTVILLWATATTAFLSRSYFSSDKK